MADAGLMERIVSSSITRYAGIFSAYILYVLIGSSIFDAIEMPAIHSREQMWVGKQRVCPH